jgi:hypothetical protein
VEVSNANIGAQGKAALRAHPRFVKAPKKDEHDIDNFDMDEGDDEGEGAGLDFDRQLLRSIGMGRL